MSVSTLWPTTFLDAERLGRPSRRAATAALEAHRSVLKGDPLKLSLANARKELALADRYDVQLINDDLDRAVEELAGLLTWNHCGG